MTVNELTRLISINMDHQLLGLFFNLCFWSYVLNIFFFTFDRQYQYDINIWVKHFLAIFTIRYITLNISIEYRNHKTYSQKPVNCYIFEISINMFMWVGRLYFRLTYMETKSWRWNSVVVRGDRKCSKVVPAFSWVRNHWS